ncbi:hypothetical protein [Vannielia litorea]|uniref:hypothetical protein n=1 Tax=Vannielia litorea TaxID=1217970 RepID=UPI001C95EE78|nr:hypothetical protein [Vannielia litorea]MBY6050038.1 hypothetical protein [Vannielia litorea]MBY6077452.1 hypothetical protein [Vannielia litorea]
MTPTITLLERDLAQAPPDYGPFRRHDAITVLADSAVNLMQHGGFGLTDLPEPLRLAVVFSGFYEAALGSFDTPSAFGHAPDGLDAAIADIALVAIATGWDALNAELVASREALATVPADMLEAHLTWGHQSQEEHERLLTLLVTNYQPVVEADVAEGYPMRRAAARWFLTQLDPATCNDTTALPPLPGTIEAARKRIGATHSVPTQIQWRASINAWRRKWRPQ